MLYLPFPWHFLHSLRWHNPNQVTGRHVCTPSQRRTAAPVMRKISFLCGSRSLFSPKYLPKDTPKRGGNVFQRCTVFIHYDNYIAFFIVRHMPGCRPHVFFNNILFHIIYSKLFHCILQGNLWMMCTVGFVGFGTVIVFCFIEIQIMQQTGTGSRNCSGKTCKSNNCNKKHLHYAEIVLF